MNSMNALIICLSAFAVTLISANSDIVSVKTKLKERLLIEFNNMTENEIRIRVENDVRAICALIRAQHLALRLQDMDYMVDVHEKKAQWFEEVVPTAWPALDKLDEKTRFMNYMIFGVSVGIIAGIHEFVANDLANHTINVTDSEQQLHTMYTQMKDKLLGVVEDAINTLKKRKGGEFLVEVHQKSYEYLNNTYTTFDTDLNSVLKTTDIREKTLQLFINEIQIQLNIHNMY